jgi:hypothetical protein
MSKCLLSLVACATGANLQLEILFNNQVKFSKILSDDPEIIKFEFDDTSNSTHTMEIVLTGKLPDHTVLNSEGSIVSDRIVEIYDVNLDNIPLRQIFLNKTIYTHDFNGTQEKIQQQFFGKMGCNGSVRFEFTSPVYLWLLENM